MLDDGTCYKKNVDGNLLEEESGDITYVIQTIFRPSGVQTGGPPGQQVGTVRAQGPNHTNIWPSLHDAQTSLPEHLSLPAVQPDPPPLQSNYDFVSSGLFGSDGP